MRIAPHSSSLLVICSMVAVASPVEGSPAPKLAELIIAGRSHALAIAETDHQIIEAETARDVAASSSWPTLSASADYTRNQRATIVRISRGTEPTLEATITPLDQVDATIQLTVPLLDLGSRRRVAAAEVALAGTRAARRATAAEVDDEVVRAYYQWLGGQALVRASTASELAATSTLAVAQQRSAAGLAVELDIARARAQQMRAARSLAEARLVVAGAVRQLATLTGIRLVGDGPALPEQLAAEPGLETFLGEISSLPQVEVARTTRDAASALVAADRAAYLPVVSAFARERVSNAAGFGETFNWAAGVQLTWSIDRRTVARLAQSRAAVATQAVRLSRATQDARDRITDAWDRVDALRAAVAASVAETDAARIASQIAQTRNAEGTGTLQQAVDAQADQLVAEVQLVRARADLAAARALLRLVAGQPVP